MDSPIPPLTEAEEQALSECEALGDVCGVEGSAAFARFVAAIRAAHEERVRKDERERVLREVEAMQMDLSFLERHEHPMVSQLVRESANLTIRHIIAALRGEGAR